MRNLLLILRYCGTAYHGWQVQANAVTVQSVFGRALTAVFGERPDCKGCSRTDTGVHADRFCVSIKTCSGLPCGTIVRALNAHLPRDIAVYGCCEMQADFHARYSALGKRYVYRVWNAPVRNPFLEERVLHYRTALDETALDRAAKHFVGEHDFKAFSAAGGSVKDTVRTISRFDVTRNGDLVEFTVEADGFLYNMVRILIGTLLWVAEGKIITHCLSEILAGKDRSAAGPTAPACGLYLDYVFYKQQDFL